MDDTSEVVWTNLVQSTSTDSEYAETPFQDVLHFVVFTITGNV